MYDRASLSDEIADAIDRSPSGEIVVRWRTQGGRRLVELAQVAEWDLSQGPEQTGLDLQVRPDEVLSPRAAENAEAVAVYRRSVADGRPLSERQLAHRFNRSKGWARDRIKEATG